MGKSRMIARTMRRSAMVLTRNLLKSLRRLTWTAFLRYYEVTTTRVPKCVYCITGECGIENAYLVSMTFANSQCSVHFFCMLPDLSWEAVLTPRGW